VLATVATAQLMVVLDGTIVNIALPAAQADLGFSDASRPWVITGYALTFGGFLLLGGRLGDRLGSRRTFVTGLAGFALASALGGAAPSFGVLVAARVLQGAFGALLAPAALAALSTTFVGSPDRGRAFGVYGAVAGGGGAIGLVLGGALTGSLSWRWCLYVNIAFAAVAILGATAVLPHDRPTPASTGLDWPGTATSVAGLFALVLGFSRAETAGWTDPSTLGVLAAGTALLVVFVRIELRSGAPLLPLSIVLHRVRGTTYLLMMLAAAGMYSVYLFLAYYMQRILGYSPLTAGVAFLPMALSVALASVMSSSGPLQRLGLRTLVPLGALLAVAGLLVLTTIDTTTSYLAHLAPGLVAAGLGLGTLFSAAMGSATVDVPRERSGIASAAVNTSQQIGGSLAIAALSTLAAAAGASNPDPIVGALSGFHAAYWGAAAALALAGLVAFCLYPRRPTTTEEPVSTPPPGSPAISPGSLPLSATVAPGDESTSIVIEPDPQDQIRRGLDDLELAPDIVYATRTSPDGSALPLALDLLRPPGGGAAPLVVYLSGGGFVVSMKDAAPDSRAHLARSGFAVASIQYRTLATGGTVTDAVTDVADAVRYLDGHHTDLGLDTSRVALWGESAGGYLAALAGLAANRPELGGDTRRPISVAAVVDEFGASDLAQIAEDFDEPTRAYYRGPDNFVAPFLGAPGLGLPDIPAATRRADPITYVGDDAPAFLLLHGSDDRLISPSQTLRLHDALRRAGADSTRYVLRGAGHGDLGFLGDPDSGLPWSTTQVMDLCTSFLHATLTLRQASTP
jgi:EmrB/QacA subfamily drug resistance transporter